MACAQKKTFPKLEKPTLLVFCGDQGFRSSPYWQASAADTAVHMLDVLHEESDLQRFNDHAHLVYRLIDVGVNYNFESDFTFWLNHGQKLINAKIGEGSANFFKYPALTSEQAQDAIQVGKKLAQREAHYGCNFLALAGLSQDVELTALVLTCALTGQSPSKLVDQKLQEKFKGNPLAQLARKALNEHPKTHDAFTLLCLHGSFEIAALTGAILAAAEKELIICLDNLPATVALLVAHRVNPAVLGYCVFPDKPYTKLEKYLLKVVGAKPLLGLKADAQPGVKSCMALVPFQEMVKGLPKED